MNKKEEEKLVEFFGQVVEIAGKLRLYELLYGDIPTNENDLEYSRKVREMYKGAEPLKSAIEKYVKENHE